ncbi:hypothetical protein [Algoriphagus formosus]|uniref:Uncharacterized protein n=1 Tax=Algoriphagus formosus TaxID=2007308 RepID=A0A4R5VGE8_9BACT|nr:MULTISPECIES: hypothetical protein [Algoriphagus]TDK50860.1 hypothetical protein E1898_00580 [Algoriphagus aquimaris]
MEKILAFIDLLGFSQMVNNDENKARVILNDFYNIAFKEIKKRPSVNGHLFSDSLLAYSDSREDLINCLAAIYQKCLLKNDSYTELSKFFLLPRGAMSVGIVNVEDRQTAPNLTKDFIVSQALVHSAKLETQIKGSRLLVAVKNEQQQQMQIDWNRNIRYGLYQDDAFTFLENYKYKDVLWFSSFDDGTNHRDNLINLIDIAIKLVKDNSRNEKVLLQHIWTLRIGLLSYSKYLGQESDPVLNRIIREFKADQYWLLWMTLIEMIVNSTNEWKYAASKKMVDFYKKTSLKKGWSNLIEELNKPGEQYALKCFEKFIDEMAIRTI